MESKEIWESQVDGRTSVALELPNGKIRTESVVGQGSRLRLTAHQRELVEELIRRPDLNPFKNGTLRHVNPLPKGEVSAEEGAPERDEGQPFSDQELIDLFALGEGDFEEGVKALTEVNIRRLHALAEADGSIAKASQAAWLKDYILETYKVGGDTPTYREMMGLDQPSS